MLKAAENFVKHLKASDLTCAVDDRGETVIVDFPYKGKVTKCVFSGEEGKYLSFYLVYEHIPDEKVADIIFLCNKFNAEYKWVTYYVDSDNDLLIHDDAIVSPDGSADEAFELLIRILKIAEDLKPAVMKTLYA